LEDLFSNYPSRNPTFSSHPELTSSEVKDDIFDLEGGNVLPDKLLDLDSTKELHSPLHVNPLSGSTTSSYSPNQLLEEFTDELALITFPPEYDDDLQFDVESDLKEIEFLLHQDIDSSLEDLIDQSLPELISTRMILELANRAICTPVGIARDVFVPVGKFTFLADFVIVDYESNPRFPLILGRPFLRTARALIDVHGEEMILH
nr:reverse transcriptase domain-containing protein [Tanacetum cinerariifolium]